MAVLRSAEYNDVQLLHSTECDISFYGTEITDIGFTLCDISHIGVIKTDNALDTVQLLYFMAPISPEWNECTFQCIRLALVEIC